MSGDLSSLERGIRTHEIHQNKGYGRKKKHDQKLSAHLATNKSVSVCVCVCLKGILFLKS